MSEEDNGTEEMFEHYKKIDISGADQIFGITTQRPARLYLESMKVHGI